MTNTDLRSRGNPVKRTLTVFLALIFLVFRPQGLFGEKIIERV